MSENHEKIQKELMDIYYGEKTMTEEIKAHIDTCSECAEFSNDLDLLSKKMEAFDIDTEMDERIIGGAFRKANLLMERRKNARDFALFALLSCLMLGIVGFLIYLGYAKSVIILQIILMICMPLSIPFIIRQRLMKEEC